LSTFYPSVNAVCCNWLNQYDFSCLHENGGSSEEEISDQLRITTSQAGRYVCQVIPSDDGERLPCNVTTPGTTTYQPDFTTATSFVPTPIESPDRSNDTITGVIVGVIVGVIIIGVIIIGVIISILKRRKNRSDQSGVPEGQPCISETQPNGTGNNHGQPNTPAESTED
ncbi:hypothetical protein BaRGS_00039584, partial [Batillaria attramentaria]